MKGMTFGVFDMLHFGHIQFLKQARKCCDKLVVCVSSDYYAVTVKGKKPILSLDDRIYLVKLSGLADEVDIQRIDSKEQLVRKHKPDILFVGSDWTPMTYGGEGLCRVKYLKYTDGISSSWYKERIINNK